MVCLYLPRHLRDAETESIGDDETAVPGGDGETVLVIDDEPLVRMLVVDVLEDLGYRAIEAGDGPSGMKVIQSKERIDLLITDVGLPNGMNGRQVADAAREVRPDLKVLFVTGYAEKAVLNQGHLEHGMSVVTKPFNVEDLGRRIGTIVRGDHRGGLSNFRCHCSRSDAVASQTSGSNATRAGSSGSTSDARHARYVTQADLDADHRRHIALYAHWHPRTVDACRLRDEVHEPFQDDEQLEVRSPAA